MKKTLSVLLAALLLLALVPAVAEETEAPVAYVTIANGELVAAQIEVELADVDEDGVVSIADALYLAHEIAFEGGAEAGFADETGEYGLMLTKLWGVENGGSYGYYVNNAVAMSLADPVEDGDFVTAFVYTDTANFSDAYSFFDVEDALAGEVTLTLSAAGYDANWAPVTAPVAGAIITVNGEKTDVVTDENGQVTLTVQAGDLVSAVSDTQTLVPPCCIIFAVEDMDDAA